MYEVQFSFKDTLGEDLASDPLQNMYIKVMDVKPTEDGEWLALRGSKQGKQRRYVSVASLWRGWP